MLVSQHATRWLNTAYLRHNIPSASAVPTGHLHSC